MRPAIASIVVCIALLIAGCSSSYVPPQTYSFDKERVYAKSFDDVRARIRAWCASKNITANEPDTAAGLITGEYRLTRDELNLEIPGYICDCGKPATSMDVIEKIYHGVGAVSIAIRKIDATSTRVIATIGYKADLYNNEYGSQSLGDTFVKVIDCTSTGRLEKDLLDFVGQ